MERVLNDADDKQTEGDQVETNFKNNLNQLEFNFNVRFLNFSGWIFKVPKKARPFAINCGHSFESIYIYIQRKGMYHSPV